MTFKTLTIAAALTVAATGFAAAQSGPAGTMKRDPGTTGAVGAPVGSPESDLTYPSSINDSQSSKPVAKSLPPTQEGTGVAGGPANELPRR